MKEIVAFAADHAGYALKQELMRLLPTLGEYAALDLGTDSEAAAEYPEFGRAAAEAVHSGQARFGVAICGSGVGISIAANRHAGIRAALCHDADSARLARRHNDANILALGARRTSVTVAEECLRAFLSTPFEGGRHARRVEMLG
jgi:ribose 5-phosphate isomerase B